MDTSSPPITPSGPARAVGRLRRLFFAPVVMASVAGASACGDGATELSPVASDPPRATKVSVTPATAEMTALGATVQLAADVRDQNGNAMAGAAVSWSSGAAAVATVSAAGLVTAAGNGTATITATAGSASGTATVTVAQEVGAVAVTPAADTVVAGDTLRLAAQVADANGHEVAGTEVEWASSDAMVAVVDSAGLVTGIGAGEAEVTATAEGVTGRTALTIVAPVPTVVAVTPDTAALTALGQNAQLAAEVRDQIGRVMEGVRVSWSSADAAIAAIDSAGLVTAIGGGATTITATAGQAFGAAVVTVMQSAGSVVVSPAADTIAPGDTLRLTAEAFDANGHAIADAEFDWSSNSASVASVDALGLVTGLAEGQAAITAAAGAARGESAITVENPDRAALVAFYNATNGPNWINNENWLTDLPVGRWHGVYVSAPGGRVRRLDLPQNNLSGQIPPGIAKLNKLSQLTLTNNSLTGPIPPELGQLIGLEGLTLQHNQMDAGPIPVEFANLVNLERLGLDPHHCATPELENWLHVGGFDVLPCTDPGDRLLPSALLREDSDGLSLALDDDLHNPLSVTVSDPAVVDASVRSGWLVLSPRSIGQADVEIVPFNGATATATVVVRAAVGTFGIDIVMDQPATEIYAETITAAADWWSSALNGTEWTGRDAREYCDYWKRNVPVAARGNDLVIWAKRETDPSFTAGATGRSCQRREGSRAEPSHYYPVAGIVTTNARVPHFFGSFFVMRHELGHVFGLTGAFPPATGLVTEDRRYFIGPRAVAAFRKGGGDPDLPGIPMNGGHWTRAVWPELMIGSSRDGRTPDELSVAALADAGYTVDMSKTTPWSRRASAAASAPVNDVGIVRRR